MIKKRYINFLVACLLLISMLLGIFPQSVTANEITQGLPPASLMSGKTDIVPLSSGRESSLIEELTSLTNIRVSYTVGTVTADYTDDSKKAVVTFTLNKACSVPVSFDYTVLFGSAGEYLLPSAGESSTTVTFNPDDSDPMTETVEIPINKLVNNPSVSGKPSNPDEFWMGTEFSILIVRI